MKPGQHDFTIYQGTTWRASLVWRDPLNNPRDLTGYTARMQIRSTIDAITALADLTTENGGITITAAEGQIDLLLTDAETAALDFAPSSPLMAGQGIYDLELESPTGEVTRLLQGNVVLDPEVTR